MPRRQGGRAPGSNSLGRALLNHQKKRPGPTVNSSSGSSALLILHAAESGAAPRVMESVTDRNNLEEFLSDALLKEEKFTAEKEQTIVLGSEAFMSPAAAQAAAAADHAARALEAAAVDSSLLKIPRRPEWRGLSAVELDRLERESFLSWRRAMADLEERSHSHLTVTPFEKNLEIWRQLWRVVEKSAILAQLVDARNPLLFFNRDLVKYVGEVDPGKRCLLIINKADYLSDYARAEWAKYFQDQEIEFVFFSAAKESSQQELREKKLERKLMMQEQQLEQEDSEDEKDDISDGCSEDSESDAAQPMINSTRVLSRRELLQYFLSTAPPSPIGTPYSLTDRLPVGLVGYPNVGKSSTINALSRAKKVNVGATPGKTKHFQTLNLADFPITLVDCPGLVFPTFLASRAELVCNGIMPIDQMSGILNYTEPVQLILDKLGSAALLDQYSLAHAAVEVSASEFLQSHALMRGFLKDHGRPDESRSARIVLKDFVNGKLLYCHPPPGLATGQIKLFEASYQGENQLTARFIGSLRLDEEEKEPKSVKKGNERLVSQVLKESSIPESGIRLAEEEAPNSGLSKKKQRRANQRHRTFTGKDFKQRKHLVEQESVGFVIHGNSGSAAVKAGVVAAPSVPIITKVIMDRTGEKTKLFK